MFISLEQGFVVVFCCCFFVFVFLTGLDYPDLLRFGLKYDVEMTHKKRDRFHEQYRENVTDEIVRIIVIIVQCLGCSGHTLMH